MNPFDLRGPEFLLFFTGCIAVVLLAIWLARRFVESGAESLTDVRDPYEIAFLREGPAAAVEVVLMSLIDRGVLKAVEPQAGEAGPRDAGKTAAAAAKSRPSVLVQADPEAGAALRRPFEKDVFAHFATPRVRVDRSITALAATARRHHQRPLQELGLLVSPRARFIRVLLALGGIGALWLVAGTKISIAFARGRTNIEFLILLAIVGSILCLLFIGGRETVAGRRFLRSLQGLFGRLRNRADRLQAGGATTELAVLAALFGLAAVPIGIFPHRNLVRRPKPARVSRGSGCGSAFSSCSSSCGGSSCGGGGCGGGCGGCGS